MASSSSTADDIGMYLTTALSPYFGVYTSQSMCVRSNVPSFMTLMIYEDDRIETETIVEERMRPGH